jgi:hypothetical protein
METLFPQKKAPHKSFLGRRIWDDFHNVLLQKIVSFLVVRNAMSTIVMQNGLSNAMSTIVVQNGLLTLS